MLGKDGFLGGKWLLCFRICIERCLGGGQVGVEGVDRLIGCDFLAGPLSEGNESSPLITMALSFIPLQGGPQGHQLFQ